MMTFEELISKQYSGCAFEPMVIELMKEAWNKALDASISVIEDSEIHQNYVTKDINSLKVGYEI